MATTRDILGNPIKVLVVEKCQYTDDDIIRLTHSDSMDIKPIIKQAVKNCMTHRNKTIRDDLIDLKEHNLSLGSETKISLHRTDSHSFALKADKTFDGIDPAPSVYSKSLSHSSSSQLHIRNQASITKYNKILKLGIFIVFLINLGTCFTIYGVVYQEADVNIKVAEVLKSFIKMRSFLIEFGIHAKEMYLIDSGVLTYVDRQETTGKMKEYVSQAEDIVRELGDNKLRPEIRDMIYSKENLWWYYGPNGFYPAEMHLIDNFYYLLNLVNQLSDAPQVSEDFVPLLEVLRNSPAETRVNCLNTVNEAFDMQIQFIDDFDYVQELTMLSILTLTLALQILVLTIIYFNFNKLRKQIWEKIFDITQASLFNTATYMKERLGYFNRDESEFSITPSKASKEHIYLQHKYQKLTYILSSVFVVVTLVTLLYIYYFSLPEIVERLHNDLSYVTSATNERNRVIMIYYLLREACTKDLLKENRYYPDYNEEVISSNNILYDLHVETFEQVNFLSPEITELYFNTEIGDYGKGLYSAVLDYRMLVGDSLKKMKSSDAEIIYVLGTLDDLTDAVLTALDDLIVMIQDRSAELIDEGIWYTLVYSISSNLALFLFMIFVLFPSVTKIKDTIQKETKIWKYLSLYNK